MRFSDFTEQITNESDLASTLERADYDTEELWTAWHPRKKPNEANKMWDALVPVAFVRSDSHRSALFTMDWETFLAWNLPIGCVRINNDLPVHGPFDSSFRVKSVYELHGCPNWSLINTEMLPELDTDLENSD